MNKLYEDMKIKFKKYTKINNAKRKSSYIESKLCKKLQLKQLFCCETRVRGKLVASPSPNYRQYICIRLQVFVLLLA